jgi:hypothetical protein
MDIPNLSNQPPVELTKPSTFSFPVAIIVVVLALVAGFALSRILPQKQAIITNSSNTTTTSTDNITSTDELKVGKVYGNSEKIFKDTATGTIEKGNINGEGTHILNREGGVTQRASLISSTVDLDLFVGKKVEIKGETNTSNKTAWLLDVGTIKILE